MSRMSSYISIDLETTGFSPTANEIIDIGAWKIKDGVVVDKFNRLVKPIGYIPREIQSITGITNEMVCAEEPIETVIVEFFDWCEDLPFLGHNLDFDYSFLCAKGKAVGCDFTLNGSRMGYDTLKLSRKYVRTSSHKLADLIKHYNINVGDNNFHRAYFDAYAAKLLYDRLVLNFPSCRLPENLNKKNIEYGEVTCNDTLSFT